MFIFNTIKLGPFLPRVMLYELILINEIEQRAKIIFLSAQVFSRQENSLCICQVCVSSEAKD